MGLDFILLSIISIVIGIIFLVIVVPPRGFIKDMPKGILKKGKFQGYAFRSWEIMNGERVYTKEYNRLLSAYLATRWVAWKLDYLSLGEGCGIRWGIEYLKEL